MRNMVVFVSNAYLNYRSFNQQFSLMEFLRKITIANRAMVDDGSRENEMPLANHPCPVKYFVMTNINLINIIIEVSGFLNGDFHAK